MYAVMIVDDDIAVRATLRDIVDWNAFGFSVVEEAQNGASALEMLEKNEFHLLITDIMMPVINGLELLTKLNEKNVVLKTLVLSSFGEYSLVREAFKLGASDYILKKDITKEAISQHLLKVQAELQEENVHMEQRVTNNMLRDYMEQKEVLYDDGHMYAILIIDVSEEQKRQSRFVDLREDLLKPMQKIILEITTMHSHCEHIIDAEKGLIFRYHKEELEQKTMGRISKQIRSVVNTYMNLEVTIGYTNIYTGAEAMGKAMEESVNFIHQRYVFGERKIFQPQGKEVLDFEKLEEKKPKFDLLLGAFKLANNEMLMEEERNLFSKIRDADLEEIKEFCRFMIYLESVMLTTRGDSIWNIFHDFKSFSDKLEKINTGQECILWMYNFNRLIFEHLSKAIHQKKEKTFEIVRRYILDNFSNEDLNLSEVAGIAGLNESYFSSKFKKEFGITFIDYLKRVRINHAKTLMETTTMKMYEVSEAVGYRNVEHFTRVFKAYEGISPKKYME
ncbi:MAG: response regulator [Bacillota bacterium]